MFFTRTAVLSLAATGSLATATDAAWGLRFEVSKDGTTWSPSVNVIEGETVFFRMSSYFTPPTPVSSTASNVTTNGNAIAWYRFVGRTIVDGLVAGESIQNMVRLSPAGGTQLLVVNGNIIGGTDTRSFASQILFTNVLATLVNNPQTSSLIYKGQIVLNVDPQQRDIVIRNFVFGAASTPGLQYFLSTADGKVGPPTAAAGGRTDLIATIHVNPGPCDPISVNSVTLDSEGLLDQPIIITADVSAAADRFLWHHNGVPMANDGRISGVTTKVLTILHPNAIDSGSYTLRSRSNCGELFTAAVDVSIPCTADLNSDAFVNDTDFVIFALAYASLNCPPGPCPADLNADGVVDDLDFLSFASQYNALLCVP